jgi:acyl-CoA oxidase
LYEVKVTKRRIRALPIRAGSKPVDHAITTFDHVHLDQSALLGNLEKPKNERENFYKIINRVVVGTLSLSVSVIPELKVCTYVAAKHNMRRTVTGADGSAVPLISFRTQQLLVFHGLSQIAVLEAFAVDSVMAFGNADLDFAVRHGIAILFKTVAVGHFLTTARNLGDELGWRGLFEHNQIIQSEVSV